jgi:uncharacterized protein YceK
MRKKSFWALIVNRFFGEFKRVLCSLGVLCMLQGCGTVATVIKPKRRCGESNSTSYAPRYLYSGIQCDYDWFINKFDALVAITTPFDTILSFGLDTVLLPIQSIRLGAHAMSEGQQHKVPYQFLVNETHLETLRPASRRVSNLSGKFVSGQPYQGDIFDCRNSHHGTNVFRARIDLVWGTLFTSETEYPETMTVQAGDVLECIWVGRSETGENAREPDMLKKQGNSL